MNFSFRILFLLALVALIDALAIPERKGEAGRGGHIRCTHEHPTWYPPPPIGAKVWAECSTNYKRVDCGAL